MKTTYFKRFTRLFMVMLLAMLPAISWAQTYISEVVVSCRENVNAAITELESNGYTVIMYDYNHNVENCTIPGVLIGYKTTSDRTKAITDLMIMEGEKYKCDDKSKQQIIGNKVYRPIKAFGDTYGDFNSGCASTASKLYLWYTKDVTGDPLAITALAGVTNSNTALSDANYVKMFNGSTVTANGDLNKGAGGDFMYIKMTKAKPERALFKRKFTTSTNSGGKIYLRNYDILKYFGIDQPDGVNNITSMGLNSVTIDGVYYDDFSTNRLSYTDTDKTRVVKAGDVSIAKVIGMGCSKKANTSSNDHSDRYRFEISIPHESVNEIKISGNLLYNGTYYYWDLLLTKDENMYFTYPYSTTNGTLYLPYSDIFRFLGYDVSEGAMASFRPLVAQVDGVACAAVSQQEISGLGSSKGVRIGTYSDAGVTIKTVNTSAMQGYISDNVPTGQEDRYGVTITYPRNEAKKYALQMYVAYTYTTNLTYANNEEEEYKMFYAVLEPDENSDANLHFCNSLTDRNTEATAPIEAKVGASVDLYTYSLSPTANTSYSVTPAENASVTKNDTYSATFKASQAGTYTVKVSQPAGNGYFASEATRTVIVTKYANSLSMNDNTITIGKTGSARQDFAALLKNSNSRGAITYRVVEATRYDSNSDQWTEHYSYSLDGSVLTTETPGKYIIECTQAETDDYESATVQATITVEPGGQTVLTQNTATCPIGDKSYIDLDSFIDEDQTFGSNSYSITYVSPDGESHSENGLRLYTEYEIGTYNIRITQKARDQYRESYADLTLEVVRNSSNLVLTQDMLTMPYTGGLTGSTGVNAAWNYDAKTYIEYSIINQDATTGSKKYSFEMVYGPEVYHHDVSFQNRNYIHVATPGKRIIKITEEGDRTKEEATAYITLVAPSDGRTIQTGFDEVTITTETARKGFNAANNIRKDGIYSYFLDMAVSSVSDVAADAEYGIENAMFTTNRTGRYVIHCSVHENQLDVFGPHEKDFVVNVIKTDAFVRDGHVKNGESLDLTTLIPKRFADANITFSGDNVSGTTFTPSENGEYTLTATVAGNEFYTERSNVPFKVTVDNHIHGKIKLTEHIHDGGGRQSKRGFKDDSEFRFRAYCHFVEYFLPAWDFEAEIEGSDSGKKKVRFSINDDDKTVTIVSGIPIRDMPDKYYRGGGISEDIYKKFGEYGQKDFAFENAQLLEDVVHDHIEYPEDMHGREQYFHPYCSRKSIKYVHTFESPFHNQGGNSENVMIDLNRVLEEQNDIEAEDVLSYYELDGDIEIPETVTFNGKDYTVTAIGNCALAYNQHDYAIDSRYEIYNLENFDLYEYTFNGVSYFIALDRHTFDYYRGDSYRNIYAEKYPNLGKFVSRLGKIKLPKTITEIKSEAFSADIYGTYNFRTEVVSSVNFTDLVNLKSIGSRAFSGTNITDLDLTKCTKLERMYDLYDDINDAYYTTHDARTNGQAFQDCRSLKSVNMKGLKIGNPTYQAKGTFGGDFELESVDMSDMPNLTEIEESMFTHCIKLSLQKLNLTNTAITNYGRRSFLLANFTGETFDSRKTGVSKDDCIVFGSRAFAHSGLKDMVLDTKNVYVDDYAFDAALDFDNADEDENINEFDWNKLYYCWSLYDEEVFMDGYYDKLKNIYFINDDFAAVATTGAKAKGPFGNSNKDIKIFVPMKNLTLNRSTISVNGESLNSTSILDDGVLDVASYSDSRGARVFPMLKSNTSGVRTMSYFRPLDYKNIKVFDNTHIYNGKKSDDSKYEQSDFFRSDLLGIKTLTPYTATDYNVENKEVTMTELPAGLPGIDALGGIYYKGTGTAMDANENEIFYILTEPEYTGSGNSKNYTNINTGVNYLKGGGRDAVDLSDAPHMTETSTQFISKGGTFYYSTPGTLAAYKAYLDLPEFIKTAADTDYSSSAKVTSLSFVWEDEPMQESETITSVNAISENRNGDIYNLQGMKVKTPQRSGLYISNGRKVLVK